MMETMIRRNQITGLYESVPVPEDEKIDTEVVNNDILPANAVVKLNKKLPVPRGKV